MNEISYKPIIDDMCWSFSRIKTYDDCGYRWFLKYIKEYQGTEKFFASYGKFIHKIIEMYYKGELTKEEMLIKYLFDFQKEVHGIRPSENIVQGYIERGANYFRKFEPFPFDVVDVEKKVEFSIDDIPFVGYIDFLGKDENDIVIVDNKSKMLKPRSNRKIATKNDLELDEMLKQLYIYSVPIYQEYGKYPSKLCFNCFQTNTLIIEKFDINSFNLSLSWAKNTIQRIKETEDFSAKQEFFPCKYICDVSDKCIHNILAIENRRR